MTRRWLLIHDDGLVVEVDEHAEPVGARLVDAPDKEYPYDTYTVGADGEIVLDLKERAKVHLSFKLQEMRELVLQKQAAEMLIAEGSLSAEELELLAEMGVGQ